jgi:hypothetical protein
VALLHDDRHFEQIARVQPALMDEPISPRISPYMPTVLVTTRSICSSRSRQGLPMARHSRASWSCPVKASTIPCTPCLN